MGISASAPWFRFYGDMPHTLNYPKKTISELVAQTAAAHPKSIAYDFMGNAPRLWRRSMHSIESARYPT